MTERQAEQYKALLNEVEQNIFKELEENYKNLLADNKKIKRRTKTPKEKPGDMF